MYYELKRIKFCAFEKTFFKSYFGQKNHFVILSKLKHFGQLK